MTLPSLAYLVICCMVCQHRGLALPLVAARGGLDSEPRSSQDHRMLESSGDNGPIGGSEPWSVDASAGEASDEKTRLLTQRELQLLADHLHSLPNGIRYLLKPIGELAETADGTPSALLYKDEKLWTARARRYAHPVGSQSFLRFGRRLKRPRDTKETAFLRFGRTPRHH